MSIAAATKAFTAMQKVPAKTWKNMGTAVDKVKKAKGSFDALQSFGEALGSLTAVFLPIITLFGIFSKLILAELQPTIQELFAVFLDPKMIELMRSLAKLIVAVFVPAFQLLAKTMKFLIDIGVIDLIIKALTSLAEGFKKFVDFLVGTGILKFIVNGFIALGKGMKWVWDTILNPLFKGIVAVFKFLANGIITVVNGLISAVNFVIPGKKYDVPLIPKFDVGGLVTQTGLAVVHAGEPIIPAAKAKDMDFDRMTRRRAEPTQINITVQGDIMDPKKLGRTLSDRIWEVK